ncbi:MAG: CcoQ/FixQ family Cbb3-type cytochrome c oxidase assembly chaperone [Cryomorphaceae bacterium]|nr:CcoQ/FixQ family Cbb3-type cytochrome c oxidase assembly chaperone [Flavobacteriales bacterium]
MLKFIKHNMESIIGVEIFPLISFIIFFSFFIGLIIYVIRLKKTSVERMSAMPLEETEFNHTPNHTGHE